MAESMARIATFLGVLLLPAAVSAQVTQRVSLGSTNGQPDADCGNYGVSISADGRFVAFQSYADNLVPGDTNMRSDIFVRDRLTGTTERVSLTHTGAQANSNSFHGKISGDGRYVAFESYATNLVPGDTNATGDVFVRDRQLGTTERVTVDSAGAQGNFGGGDYGGLSISADGRYVAFNSGSTNLVAGDTNGWQDVFLHDRQTGVTELVSVSSSGVQGNYHSSYAAPSISADGRYVAFTSYASNLVPGDTNGKGDVFVRDRQTGTTERVSLDSNGAEGDDASVGSSFSTDGRFVAFGSYATNLVPGDTNGSADVFVRDRLTGTTERVSVDSAGGQGGSVSGTSDISISTDGRYVAFDSNASNLVPGDTNGVPDIFVRDRLLGTTERISVSSSGAQANGWSYESSMSSDGRYVAFRCGASNLVPGDTDQVYDVFVRDRQGAPAFTSLCDPGTGGVTACPCSNPPSGPGRGCDNSYSTGGAVLSASGATYLASDSLVFTTAGEKPIALSIVLQGTAAAPSGIVYGQGVRCVAGSLKRLYAKTASGGSITAPDFAAGDPAVSAESAAKGDVIQPGQSRWYLVYYRDPTVLGGCPATSTFNSTQTGQVTWSY